MRVACCSAAATPPPHQATAPAYAVTHPPTHPPTLPIHRHQATWPPGTRVPTPCSTLTLQPWPAPSAPTCTPAPPGKTWVQPWRRRWARPPAAAARQATAAWPRSSCRTTSPGSAARRTVRRCSLTRTSLLQVPPRARRCLQRCSALCARRRPRCVPAPAARPRCTSAGPPAWQRVRRAGAGSAGIGGAGGELPAMQRQHDSHHSLGTAPALTSCGMPLPSLPPARRRAAKRGPHRRCHRRSAAV